MQAFFLGIANGVTCLAFCAPVLIPIFMSGHQTPQKSWLLLAKFLFGRFLGYLVFGLLAWATNQLIILVGFYNALFFGSVYLGLAILMLINGIISIKNVSNKLPNHTECQISPRKLPAFLKNSPQLLPIGLGLLTGLNLCPPFLMAFANATFTPSLLDSLFFFTLFFVGTSLFFLPVPFLGLLNRKVSIQTIGNFVSILIAFYYFYSGFMQILGGFYLL